MNIWFHRIHWLAWCRLRSLGWRSGWCWCHPPLTCSWSCWWLLLCLHNTGGSQLGLKLMKRFTLVHFKSKSFTLISCPTQISAWTLILEYSNVPCSWGGGCNSGVKNHGQLSWATVRCYCVNHYKTKANKKANKNDPLQAHTNILQCWLLFSPHSCGTWLPPVTRKKSVWQSPSVFGPAMSKVWNSRRIYERNIVKQLQLFSICQSGGSYLANVIIEPVDHQIADPLWWWWVDKVSSIFRSGPATLKLN